MLMAAPILDPMATTIPRKIRGERKRGKRGMEVIFQINDKSKLAVMLGALRGVAVPDGVNVVLDSDGRKLALDQQTENYAPEPFAEYVLSNVANAEEYASACDIVRALGIDPETVPHYKPEDVESLDAWAARVTEEAVRDAKENPMTDEEAGALERKLAAYDGKKSAEMGILSDDDIVRMINEDRRERREKAVA